MKAPLAVVCEVYIYRSYDGRTVSMACFWEDLVPSPSINSDLKSGVSRFTSPEFFFNLMATIFETQKRFFKSSAIGCCHTVFKMFVFSC